MRKLKFSPYFTRTCLLLAVLVGLLTAMALPAFAKGTCCPSYPPNAEPCVFPWPTLEQLQALGDTDFKVLFPNVYTDYEKDLVYQYLADNALLRARGPIDVHKLVDDPVYRQNTVGVGPVFTVTREMVLYENNKYDPENLIRHDSAYAKAAGYQDILAFMSFGTCDDFYMVPWPRLARDKMLVSDLNHSVTSYVPIYPGDTLYLVADERIVLDITPPQGSTYRSVVLQTKGSVYNQRYEKVNDVTYRVTEGERQFTDAAVAKYGHPPADCMPCWWEAPDWTSRLEHYYTDADWEFIKSVWRQEEIRGSKPRYWEDVKIGDQPRWTLEGPIYEGLRPTLPYGMGLYGSRTLKKEILDPKILSTMYRSPLDGIFYLWPNPNDQDPAVPGDPTYPGAWPGGDPGDQTLRPRFPPLTNFTTRDFAIRHITNWMSDHGWLLTIGWSIMDPRCHADFGSYVPTSPLSVRYLEKVPSLRCCKYVDVHGLQKDIAIVKSYVVNKWICNGKYEVELVWWVEDIEGDIWTEGGAIVQLPSKCQQEHEHGDKK